MKSKSTKVAILTAIAAAMLAVDNSHAVLTFEQMVGSTNIFTEGNFYANSEAEGPRIWIGGMLYSPNANQFGFNTGASDTDVTLLVQGGITAGGDIHINEGSYVGKTATSANIIINSGGTGQTSSAAYAAEEANIGWTVGSFSAALSSASNSFAAMPADGTVNYSDMNNVKITGSGAAVSYVSVPAWVLDSANGITLDNNGSQVVVVNVYGSSTVTTDANFMGSSMASADNFLWNVPGVTSFTSERRLDGSLFLVDGNALLKGGINGGYFGETGTINDEAHSYLVTLPVPEPGTTTMFGFGLALVLSRMRKRNR